MRIGYAFSALCLTALAATPDAHAILTEFVDAAAANGQRANQYTYLQQVEYFVFDKSGAAKPDRSETREIIFVEGEQYQKLVARNGHPLDAKEQAKEDKREQLTAQERRKKRRSGLTISKEVTLGTYADLLTLFDNRVAGEEELRGHKVWVIESTPRAGRKPANKHEKEAMSFSRRLWIDQTSHAALRSIETVVGEHILFMPGTTISIEFDTINNDAWLESSLVIDGRMQFAKMIKPRIRTEYHNSKFQKFDVKSTISTEPR